MPRKRSEDDDDDELFQAFLKSVNLEGSFTVCESAVYHTAAALLTDFEMVLFIIWTNDNSIVLSLPQYLYLYIEPTIPPPTASQQSRKTRDRHQG